MKVCELEQMHGVCKGYFYVLKCNRRFKTLKETVDYFVSRMDAKNKIAEEYQRIYYELADSFKLHDFGRFLEKKGLIKTNRSISTIFSLKFKVPEHKMLSEKNELRSMQLIEAYGEYRCQK
ncbi:MAG: hypothetical protein EOL93_00535 [Epsilonproteobacteria bacterium]|nr:hypothetical protein [Campylobacterota bacterium]